MKLSLEISVRGIGVAGLGIGSCREGLTELGRSQPQLQAHLACEHLTSLHTRIYAQHDQCCLDPRLSENPLISRE